MKLADELLIVPTRDDRPEALKGSCMSAAALKFTDSLSDRVRRLRAEAQSNARSHVNDFVRALAELEALAADIAVGGEAYPVGIRESARQLSPELEGVRLNVTSLLGRDAA
jgi:hypothetical protein